MSDPCARPDLSVEDWERVRSIFADTIAQPADERHAFLDVACVGAPEVRRQVESLLRAHDRAGDFLEMGGVRAIAPWATERSSAPNPDSQDEDDDPLIGCLLGPYRLTRLVGRGGMGRVYFAERADDLYDREVAIKVVSAGPAGLAGVFARPFSREQRILASLVHPHIAQLLDAGATPEGAPYLVMEYVEGQNIIAHCEAEALSIEQRLRLFDGVCAAVEFAHTRMVVHRDLKPSNILVTADGSPKLLDFGVASLLQAEESTAEDHTTIDFRALTPEYASPEQLRGEPVSMSSDVWALGVLLYRLLTGAHPFTFDTRSPLEIERVIRDERPVPPSEAIAKPDPDVRRARARRLRGDLDNIILTALRVEPGRRYGTVTRLRADIQAHLGGYPVSARSNTWSYRTSRFVRRNRLGVATASILIASILAALTGVAWQSRLAVREAGRAEATLGYLVEMFGSLDPDVLGGRAVTARELLDIGVARLESQLDPQPEVQAEVAGVLGQMFQRLGLYSEARPLLESSYDFAVSGGSRDKGRALAASRLASLLHEQGELAEARELATLSLDVRRRVYGPRDTSLADGYADLGVILSEQGEYDEARGLLLEALEIDREAGRRDAVARGLDHLGLIEFRFGEFGESRSLHEEALATRLELYGESDTRTALSLLNLSEVLSQLGEYDLAIEALDRCLAIRRNLLGEQHPDVAVALNALGNVYQRIGDLEAAEHVLLEALAIRRAVFGDRHPETAVTQNGLGVVLYFLGDHAAAAERFADAVSIWTEQLGDEHPDVLSGLNNLGAAQREAGDLSAAEAVLRQVLAIRRRTLGEGHADFYQSLNNLAVLLAARGQYVEAEAGYTEAIAGWRATLGPEHPTTAFAMYGLGRLLYQLGRFGEAETQLRDALSLRTAALEPESTDIAVVRYHLGLCLLAVGRVAEARSHLEAALPPIEAQWGEEHEFAIGIKDGLRRVASQEGSG